MVGFELHGGLLSVDDVTDNQDGHPQAVGLMRGIGNLFHELADGGEALGG